VDLHHEVKLYYYDPVPDFPVLEEKTQMNLHEEVIMETSNNIVDNQKESLIVTYKNRKESDQTPKNNQKLQNENKKQVRNKNNKHEKSRSVSYKMVKKDKSLEQSDTKFKESTIVSPKNQTLNNQTNKSEENVKKSFDISNQI